VLWQSAQAFDPTKFIFANGAWAADADQPWHSADGVGDTTPARADAGIDDINRSGRRDHLVF